MHDLQKLCVEGYEWLGFRTQCRLVTIGFELETLEPLRIGAGRVTDPYSPVDLPVLRYNVVLPDGKVVRMPVIPGSSFKGVLRTASMVLASKCGVKAHSGVGDDDCVVELCARASNFDNLRKDADIDTLKKLLLGFCPTCLLYGTKSYSAHVIVNDFTPTANVATGVKTGVGINRRTGAAAPHVLYTVEYVEAGSVFKGGIILHNPTNWMLALLSASLLAIHEGLFKLGGFKSRGMGRVKIVENSMEISIYPVNTAKLEPLDSDIDEPIDLGECSLEGNTLRCKGLQGFNVLRKLADQWYNVYCKKMSAIYNKRVQEARNICSVTALG